MEAREVLDLALGMVNGNQAELARRLQRSETTVSRWATGRNGIDFESALRLARMTGLPAHEVVNACGLDPSLVPSPPAGEASVPVDPEWVRFVAQIEAGWRAMDDTARDIAKRTAQALFHVEPVQRRRRITDDPQTFDRSNPSNIAPTNGTKPYVKREPRSLTHQRMTFGFQPAY